jgi:hypothetical protein
LNSPTFLGRSSSTTTSLIALRRAALMPRVRDLPFVKSPERRRRRHRDRRPRRYGLLRVARPAQPPESTALFSDLIETFPRRMFGLVDCKPPFANVTGPKARLNPQTASAQRQLEFADISWPEAPRRQLL